RHHSLRRDECADFGGKRDSVARLDAARGARTAPLESGRRVTCALVESREDVGLVGADLDLHYLAEATPESARAPRVGSKLTPTRADRRQRLDPLRGHAGDAARVGGGREPILATERAGTACREPGEGEVTARPALDAGDLRVPEPIEAGRHHPIR